MEPLGSIPGLQLVSKLRKTVLEVSLELEVTLAFVANSDRLGTQNLVEIGAMDLFLGQFHLPRNGLQQIIPLNLAPITCC